MKYEHVGKELSLISVDEDELTVTLSDGSEWRVKPGDASKIGIWYDTQRIVVSENDSDIYPYLLTNRDTAGPDVVEASRV